MELSPTHWHHEYVHMTWCDQTLSQFSSLLHEVSDAMFWVACLYIIIVANIFCQRCLFKWQFIVDWFVCRLLFFLISSAPSVILILSRSLGSFESWLMVLDVFWAGK